MLHSSQDYFIYIKVVSSGTTEETDFNILVGLENWILHGCSGALTSSQEYFTCVEMVGCEKLEETGFKVFAGKLNNRNNKETTEYR